MCDLSLVFIGMVAAIYGIFITFYFEGCLEDDFLYRNFETILSFFIFTSLILPFIFNF